jgi:hypothetical protein
VKTSRFVVLAVLIGGLGFARADLISEFSGFDTVWETGVSGLLSSYDADTRAGLPLTGPTTGVSLPTLGAGRVTYPGGIGQVPSPGGSIGRHFDEGVLGLKIVGNELIVQLAGGLDPQTGYYYSGWKSWYSQGDLFIDVQDSLGISHYALLSAWARDDDGDPIHLNRGRFNTAEAFHVSGGPGGGSLEGHLVGLRGDSDVALTGGNGSYNSSNAPAGLDIRAFAQNGNDLGDTALTHRSVSDLGQTWYIQTWTLDLGDLSSDSTFDLGLHSAMSCGNDQIGGVYSVPEPGMLALTLLGVAAQRLRRPV